MKKFLPAAPFISLLFGSIAMALQLWFRSAGTDSSGLLPQNHPSQILLLIISAAAVILFWLLSRQLDKQENAVAAPRSPISAAGYLAAGAGLLLFSVSDLATAGDRFEQLLALVGLASGLGFAWGGWLRLQAKPLHFVIHALPTLYFALRVFLMGKTLGAEPELSRFILQFLATLALLPAMYQLWGLSVELGRGRKLWFWSLSAGYFCLAAAIGSGEILLYGAMAALLLTNLPEPKPAEAELPEEAPAQEAPGEASEIPGKEE